MSIFDDLIHECNVKGEENSFGELGVSKNLINNLKELGINSPTQIQREVIPVALKGSDVFACAKTGSGKTLSFALPLIQRMLLKAVSIKVTRALVILPTRELALQVYDVFQHLASGRLSLALVVGGQSNKEQEAQIRKRPDIIICTPGRLIDHLYNCPTFCLEAIEFLILDEADRLLDENFIDQLKEIVKHASVKKQTMLFSATLNDGISSLASLALKNPVRIFVDPASTLVGTLTQHYIKLKNDDLLFQEAIVCCKYPTYTDICQSNDKIVLIFCDTKKEAHRLCTVLHVMGLDADELHGDMTQEKRRIAISRFRNNEFKILVSTSLASRGLDVSCISLVINYHAPKTLEEYVHRVGRTARAGRPGLAITLFKSEERKYWKMIVKGRKDKFSAYSIDQKELTEYRKKLESLQSQIDAKLKEDKIEKSINFAEREATTAENLIKYQKEIESRPPKRFMGIQKKSKFCSEEIHSKKFKKSFKNVKGIQHHQKNNKKFENPVNLKKSQNGRSSFSKNMNRNKKAKKNY